MRIVTFAQGIARELNGAWGGCEWRSFLRWGADMFAYRYMRLRRPKRYDSRRVIRLKNGVEVVYRLNRADIQTVREVWFDETYQLPFDLPGAGGTLVDLGGNIGLTSVYLARRHGFSRVVIVEPVAENAALARLNCELNGIDAEIVQAAIAPRAGEVNFSVATERNLGHINAASTDGITVRATTIPHLVGPSETIRLVKVDIEGGEGPLLTEETGWLDRVLAVAVEFHPAEVDYPRLVEVLTRRGFTFFPAGSVHPLASDAFLRGS
jgi:FkbM family methyltransferase